jgi:hypothetical protein
MDHGSGTLVDMGLTGISQEKLAGSIGDQVERTTDDLGHVRFVFGHLECRVQVGVELVAVRRSLKERLLAGDLGPLRRQDEGDREAAGDGECGECRHHEDRGSAGVATKPTPQV